MSLGNFSKGTQQSILGSQYGEMYVKAIVEGDTKRERSLLVNIKHQTPSFRKAFKDVANKYLESKGEDKL